MSGMMAAEAGNLWAWGGTGSMLLILVLLGTLYLRGAKAVGLRSAVVSVPLTLWLATALLVIALLAPTNRLARQFFYVHVLQQLLLVAWVPGLIMLSRPLPLLKRGVPRRWRARVRLWASAHRDRLAAWRWAAGPGTAYVLFTAVFWLWHDPTLHGLMLASPALWTLEKVTLLGAALLYWWHISGASAAWYPPLPPMVRALYTLMGAWPIKVTGLVLLFGGTGFYAYPGRLDLPGVPFDAHGLGSMIVWVAGGVFYTTVALGIVREWLMGEEVKPPLPLSAWASDDAMRAPGL